MTTAKKLCITCGAELVYDCALGAPGYGHSWKCPKCGETHWVHGITIQRFRDVSGSDLEMNPDDVI